MHEQELLDGQVREWEAEGRWVDRGHWIRSDNNGTLEYIPTKREIRAKCRLFRTIEGWRGAAIRMPRDGEYAIASTAGL